MNHKVIIPTDPSGYNFREYSNSPFYCYVHSADNLWFLVTSTLREWLDANGIRTEDWSMVSYYDDDTQQLAGAVFSFSHLEHAVLFKLRWGGR